MRWEDKCLVFESQSRKPEVRLSEVQSNSLLGCPFCGRRPFVEPWHGGGPDKHAVDCIHDECTVNPQTTGETLQEALNNWNTRQPNHTVEGLTAKGQDT